MADLTIAPAAREDLMDIGRYTQDRWGPEQRTDYLRGIADLFDRLASGETRGRHRPDLRKGLWSQPHGSHVVFFRRDPEGNVQVLRVLHQAQDHERHL